MQSTHGDASMVTAGRGEFIKGIIQRMLSVCDVSIVDDNVFTNQL